MAEKTESRHGMWSNSWMFVLAAAGSAVGLGNIWKFPYITGENGGGAFVLLYLFCVAIVGIPIMMAEVLIGREMSMPKRCAYIWSSDVPAHRSEPWVCLGWDCVRNTALERK